jgi:methylmalonyl-CoA mutase N-terminal domain/subunit
VGVNKFHIEEHQDTPLLHIDDSIRESQSRKLQSLRSRRNAEAAKACLAEVRAAATGTDNLMPVVIKAVEHYCTLGEIADELRAVYGEYK